MNKLNNRINMNPQITRCMECGYEALTWGLDECSKCEGKLEILAKYEITKSK